MLRAIPEWVYREECRENPDILWKYFAQPNVVVLWPGHGSGVRVVKELGKSMIFGQQDEIDALVAPRSTVLAISGADCPPVYIASARGQWHALIHASRESVRRGIVEHAVQELHRQEGEALPLRAYLGPGIHAEHYEMQEEDREQWPDIAQGPWWHTEGQRLTLDLYALIGDRLRQVGVEEQEVAEEDTYASSSLASYRRLKPGKERIPTNIFFT